MKAIGVMLLGLGLIGLMLDLIFWLPTNFNPIMTAIIGVVCLVAVWGGGRIAQPAMQPARAATSYDKATQSAQWMPLASATCPKCGSQVMPGQQYCGGCGSGLQSYCAGCGNPLSEPSRFCGKCGTRLS